MSSCVVICLFLYKEIASLVATCKSRCISLRPGFKREWRCLSVQPQEEHWYFAYPLALSRDNFSRLACFIENAMVASAIPHAVSTRLYYIWNSVYNKYNDVYGFTRWVKCCVNKGHSSQLYATLTFSRSQDTLQTLTGVTPWRIPGTVNSCRIMVFKAFFLLGLILTYVIWLQIVGGKKQTKVTKATRSRHRKTVCGSIMIFCWFFCKQCKTDTRWF